MNRVWKWMLLAVVVLTMTMPAFAATGNAKVDWLIEQKIVVGDGSGSYKLENPITRAEATKMLVESLGKRAEADALKSTAPKFKDVKANDWYVGYLNYAVSKNIIAGYEDNTFKPQNNVTYAEMIKMLVVAHEASDGKEISTGFWALPYIDKAQKLHYLDGVISADYNGAAPRGKVFEMIYNAMHGGDSLNLAKDQYYGLITQNSPTVQVRIIASGADSAHRIGSYVNLGTLNLHQGLGDVLKVNVNDRGVVSNASLATNVKLIAEPAALSEKQVTIGGLNYALPKGYAAEKMLSHNDQEFRYDEFVAKNRGNGGANDTFLAEYARVYVEGNRVLYVDCYSFDDIAAVRSGMAFGTLELYLYDDYRDGEIRTVTLNELKLVDGKKVETLRVEDVKADDVVHIYDRNKALIARANVAEGSFKGIRQANGVYYMAIGGKEYQARVSTAKRPVYRVIGGVVSTMYVERNHRYPELEGKNTKALLDLNSHVQLLEGNQSTAENLGLFNSFVGRNEAEIVGIGRLPLSGAVNYSIGSQRAVSSDFRATDLVLVDQAGGQIVGLNRILSGVEMERNATVLERDRFNSPNITSNTITLAGGGGLGYNSRYTYDSNTKIFVVQGDTVTPGRMADVKMPFVIDNFGQATKAFVLTTDQYDKLVSSQFNTLDRATTDKAKVIVFFDMGRYEAPIAANAYRVTKDFTPGDHGMTLRRGGSYSDNFYEFADMETSRKASYIPAGTDIQVSFDAREKITSIDRTIASEVGRETYKVDYYIPMTKEYGNGKLIISDRYSKQKTFVIHIENVNNLNGVKQGDVISMEYSGDELIQIMDVYPSNTEVTGTF